MPEKKDAWDKFEIVFKLLILGAIPIVIGMATDNVAQSLKRGELIQTLLQSLSAADNRRDIALIALDHSIPPYKKCEIMGLWNCKKDIDQDTVIQIAKVLLDESIEEAIKKGQTIDNISVITEVLSGPRRGSQTYYATNFADRINSLTKFSQARAVSDTDTKTRPSNKKIAQQAFISKIIAEIQPKSEGSMQPMTLSGNLTGVRLVYIQYNRDEQLAKEIQKVLQDSGISAPGLEKKKDIKENDIRYANSADKQTAEALKKYLEEKETIEFTKPIDLSQAGYRVPLGQFEVWLK